MGNPASPHKSFFTHDNAATVNLDIPLLIHNSICFRMAYSLFSSAIPTPNAII